MNNIFKKLTNSISGFLCKNDSKIAITGAVIFTIASIGTAIYGTTKADKIIRAKKEELIAAGQPDKIPPSEIIKMCWRCYIPTILTTGLAITCLTKTHSIYSKKTAQLATACSLSDLAYREMYEYHNAYRDNVASELGKDKEREIKQLTDKNTAEKKTNDTTIIVSDSNENTCYDVSSGRIFVGSINDVREAVLTLNERMLSENDITLNEYYYALGLDATSTGEYLGWDIEHGKIDLYFGTTIIDNKPVITVGFSNEPRAIYS